MRNRWNRLSMVPVVALLLAACCCPCPDRCGPGGGAGGADDPTMPGRPHTPAYFKRLRLVNKDKTAAKKNITSATADLQDSNGGTKGSKVLVGVGGIQTTPLLPTQHVDWTPTSTTDVATVKLSIMFSDSATYTALVCLASNEPCGSGGTPAPCGVGGEPLEFVQSTYWGRDDWPGGGTNTHKLEHNRRHFDNWNGTGWIMAESCPSGGAPFNAGVSSWGKELCTGDNCYRP